MTKEEIINSLQIFKERRDDLMHEDVNGFEHLANRFVDFCESNSLLQDVLKPLKEKFIDLNSDYWWNSGRETNEIPNLPTDQDEELILRYKLLEDVKSSRGRIHEYSRFCGSSKLAEAQDSFRSLILRPLMSELNRRVGEAASLATPEAREIQAVPLNRIPSQAEARIFLSHKNENKELVRHYYNALKEGGFDPWIDESNMAAGANLERELLRGFEESCAVVFFITEHFTDEKYLATEIDYAIQQKRKKGKKFSIITLKYPAGNEIPPLLATYIYKEVSNHLDAFLEILKGLPIELGSVRWKKDSIE